MSIDIPAPTPSSPATNESDTKRWIIETVGESGAQDFRHAYQQLHGLYELTGEERTHPKTLTGMIYRSVAYGALAEGAIDFQKYEDNTIISMTDTTRSIRNAVQLLRTDFGCDPLVDRNCFSNNKTKDQIIDILQQRAIGDRVVDFSDPRPVQDLDAFVARTIVEIMGANANTFRSGADNQDAIILRYGDDQNLMNIAAVAIMRKNFYHTAAANVSQIRYEGQRSLRRICGDEFNDYLTIYDKAIAHFATPDHDEVVAEEILASKKLELDYRILPPGTDLRNFAEAFSEQASESVRPHIDLNRLKVLDDLRQRIGSDKCFFMTGKPSGKSMPDESGKTIAEDYIGLVIQHHDHDGNVVGEDCVATSPVARKHAGYIVRHDASAGLAWRDILQMSKRDATKYFNARSLRFDPVEGKDTYEAFVEKTLTLLSCPPEQFDSSYHLTQKKDGTYKMRHRGADVAKGVLSILSTSSTD